MATRVDPKMMEELKAYGAVGIEKCFNCGTCTAICPLTSDEHPFPRNMIRLAQLGLKDHLTSSLDPWLCYYCGDCSTSCPRGAEPGETMMAARRWLTAQYDRSGHSARMYTSERVVWLSIARITLLTLAFFVIYHLLGLGRIETGQVALNQFAPVYLIWAFVLLHFAYLGIRLLSNTVHMFRPVMDSTLREGKIPLGVYLGEFKTFIINFLTQKRWRDCDPSRHQRWLVHLLLVSGYVIMLVLVVGLLGWFQTDNIYPLYHPQRWLGYYATIVLIYASVDMLIGRIRKQDQMHRFTQPTDWLFPTFILFGAVSGILVHIFRYVGWPWPTYIIYVIHVMAMVGMLDTEVGIGKWTHLIYRPLAMYLEAVKIRAKQHREAAAGALAPAD
jgi:quinone-modifying oxidoreductase subunit QmoC